MPADMPGEQPSFLAGCGELGQLIERFDWSSTSLGLFEAWPNAVKTTVGLILSLAGSDRHLVGR